MLKAGKSICIFRTVITLLFLSVTYGCEQGKPAEAPDFDEKLAWRLCKKAASMVPRHSGTEGAKQQAEFIGGTARKFGAAIKLDTFRAVTPDGNLTFRNVIAKVPGQDNKRYLIVACHYDGKKLLSVPEFQAANDGASGVGLLLSMIKSVVEAKEKPLYSLRFVFFDGEECIYEYKENDGLFGSKYYCEKLKKSHDLKNCRAMILVDMIGDKDLSVTLSQDTPKELFELCMESAKKLGYEKYFDYYKGNILDDHVPFSEAGVPAIDLIDFNFGPQNSYWHTADDTIDKMSPESLKIIGQVVLDMIYSIK